LEQCTPGAVAPRKTTIAKWVYENYALFVFSCSHIAFFAFKRFRKLAIRLQIRAFFLHFLQLLHSETPYIWMILSFFLLHFTIFLLSVSKICNFHSYRYNGLIPETEFQNNPLPGKH
jgi:hypothetical protein